MCQLADAMPPTLTDRLKTKKGDGFAFIAMPKKLSGAIE
jgi:hypothetical protein